MAVAAAVDTACRLCGGATTPAYETILLNKYQVRYYCCQQCGSLQTEWPYWLSEAYGAAAASIDPGAAQRVLDSFALVDLIARLFGCRKLLDFGGNTGFLCRLLRDRGYDAYSFDRYVTPFYVPHFVGSPLDPHDLVTAFEVMEHFSSPATDLEQIFGARPKVVLATTELFSGQPSDWWYLAPSEGQHVFFYSEKAAQLIAKKYHYSLVIGPRFLLFSRVPVARMRRQLMRRCLRPRLLRIWGAMRLMRSGPGAEKDFAMLTQGAVADEGSRCK